MDNGDVFLQNIYRSQKDTQYGWSRNIYIYKPLWNEGYLTGSFKYS